MSAADSQKKIQDSVSEMMLDLDRKQLRKMQVIRYIPILTVTVPNS